MIIIAEWKIVGRDAERKTGWSGGKENESTNLKTYMLGDLVSVCLSCLAEHDFLLATKMTN